MVIPQLVEEACLHEESYPGGCIHLGGVDSDAGAEVSPVYGQPAVGQETCLQAGLQVLEHHVAEVPGLHVPQATVVMPHLQAKQVPQGSENFILNLLMKQ